MIEVVEQQRACARGHDARSHQASGGDIPRPALADVGLLCGDCYRRLEYRLDDLPEIIRQARAEVVPGLSGGSSEPVSGTKERRLPFDTTALEASDDLFSMLANWAMSVSRALDVPPPAELRGVHGADANVNGLASWASAAAAADTAEGTVRWMLEHLAAAAALPLIVDLFDELVPAIERAHGRWGMTGAKMRRRSKPCPACGGDVVRVAWSGHEASMWCRGCLLPLTVDWTVLT